MWTSGAIGIVISYFVGSIPFGYLAARLVKGIDIREHGSRNIGATNVGRVLGVRYFVLVFLLDFAKGLVPTMLMARAVGQTAWGAASPAPATVFCGLAAICGHIWPIYLRFKGGKAVATTLGVFFWLVPKAFLAGVIAFAVLLAAFRYVSVGSMAAAVVMVAVELLTEPDPWGAGLSLTVVCALVAALILLRHRTNIQRLLAGTENRLGRKKETPTP